MINLLDILDIIAMVHVLKGLDQVSKLAILTWFLLPILIILIDKWLFNLVLSGVIDPTLISAASVPEYLAIRAVHLFV